MKRVGTYEIAFPAPLFKFLALMTVHAAFDFLTSFVTILVFFSIGMNHVWNSVEFSVSFIAKMHDSQSFSLILH